MKEFELKYGCNPNQKPAHLDLLDGGEGAHSFAKAHASPNRASFIGHNVVNDLLLVRTGFKFNTHFVAPPRSAFDMPS